MRRLIKWIDVNERLPPNPLQAVLVCLENDMVTEMLYLGGGWYKWGFGDLPKTNNVKFWAYMPLPPKI